MAPAPSSACWAAEVATPSAGPVRWSDVTERWGGLAPLLGMKGHAAAWGDVNGDGWLDLFVGTFADRPEKDYQVRGASGPAPDRLLLGGPDGFREDPSFPGERGRTSGAVFADLDNDGDLDVVLARNVRARRAPAPPDISTTVLENQDATFRPAARLLPTVGARSVGVLDYDRDGRLDLFVAEDRFRGGSGVLLRNLGGWQFDDVTLAAGLQRGIEGMGVATADLNVDGWPDLFVAGSNRLFVNEAGRFRELDGASFAWAKYGEEDDPAGVAVGDLDRDGLPDLVVGQHYNSTLDQHRRVPVRIYRNVTPEGEAPRFEDVTGSAAVPDLPTKAPHVELADLDNDGWLDVVTSASAEAGSRPAVLRNVGSERGLRFEPPASLGAPQYWVTGGAVDADHDGRLDLFLAEWEESKPSVFLRNDGPAGHWLEVQAVGSGSGVGTVVELYQAGRGGDAEARLARSEIGVTVGFGAGRPAVARFGLGRETVVDVVVTMPGAERQMLSNVRADQHLRLGGSCS